MPHPSGRVVLPMEATTTHFATAARILGREARERGLVVPGYRCPPRVVGADRTLRRFDGGAIVAVRVKGRPWVAVLADMIEGLVVANRLAPPSADRLRDEMWEALGFAGDAGVVGRGRKVA